MLREMAPLTGLQEGFLLQEGKILASWLNRVPPEASDLAASLAVPMKELLLLMYEFLSGERGDAVEDTRHAAYRVAEKVLDEHDYHLLIAAFRDALQDSVMVYVTPEGQRARDLIAFFNTVTDGYWLAHIDGLRKTIRHNFRERQSNELRVAKRIQEKLLPKVIPEIPGWQFAGRLVPAVEVGGDYWSIKHYPADGVLTCKLADVTGHGVGAAILVSGVKFISGGFYRGAPSPSWVMEKTNHVLVVETPADIMVTMVYGWLKPDTGEIRIVNAGHHPVFICREGKIVDIPATGLALGVLESRYAEVKHQLLPGDILFFCSDGIIEARNRNAAIAQDVYGVERLHDLICQHSELSAGELADKVIHSAIAFSGTPNDDMSLMVIKRLPAEEDTPAPEPAPGA